MIRSGDRIIERVEAVYCAEAERQVVAVKRPDGQYLCGGCGQKLKLVDTDSAESARRVA